MKRKLTLLGVLGLFLLALSGCGGKTVDVEKLFKISGDGVEGFGRLIVEKDPMYYSQFSNEIAGVKAGEEMDPESTKKYLKKASEIADAERFLSNVSYIVANPAKSDYKNGDKVKIDFIYDEKIAKDTKLKLNKKSIEYKFSDLKTAQEIDPFASVDVKFAGIDTFGKLDYSADKLPPGVSLEFDKTNNLKNGESISAKVHYDKESLARSGYILTKEEQAFTVSGLEAAKEVDPFADVTVSYEGMDGSGVINVVNNNQDLKGFEYYSEESSYLKNGDDVKVNLYYSGGPAKGDELADSGILISPTSKTFKVEGLGFYIEKPEDVSEEALNAMKAQAEDVIKTDTSSWNDKWYVSKTEYVGMYVLKLKDGLNLDWGDTNNSVSLVYKITANYDGTRGDYNKDNKKFDFPYYIGVRFFNISKTQADEVHVDTTKYDKLSDSFSKEGGDTYSYRFRGYETRDLLFKNEISKHVERYKYTTDIK